MKIEFTGTCIITVLWNLEYTFWNPNIFTVSGIIRFLCLYLEVEIVR